MSFRFVTSSVINIYKHLAAPIYISFVFIELF